MKDYKTNDITNKNKETMATEFIRLGHYRSVKSLGNDHATIIRIIGRDAETGKYKSMDGDLYTETELKRDFVLLDTRSQLNINEKRKPLLMGDIPEYSEIDPTKQGKEEKTSTKTQSEIITAQEKTISETQQVKTIETEPKVITKEVIIKTKLEDEILQTCITNAKNYDIVIKDFPIKYNLEQLQMIKKLKLGDFDYMLNKIVDDIIQKDDILKTHIKNFITQLIENINKPTPTVTPIMEEVKKPIDNADNGVDNIAENNIDTNVEDKKSNVQKYIESEILGIEERLNKK